jgi:hypothetical protein
LVDTIQSISLRLGVVHVREFMSVAAKIIDVRCICIADGRLVDVVWRQNNSHRWANNGLTVGRRKQ